MKTRLFALLLLAVPTFAFSQYKPWYDFYNFAFGAKARSMGNAFVAVADDLTAVFWNPAGLAAKHSPEFYLSYMTTSQKHDYDMQDKVMADETKLYNYNFSGKLNQIDYFSIVAPAVFLRRPFSVALSYYRYIPYGFKGSVQEVVTFLHDRFHPKRTTVSFTGSEGIDVLAFSAAAAVTDSFSLGATLQQFFGSGSLHLRTVNPSGGELNSQYTEKLGGRSFIVGALFSPFKFMRLGFAWHSSLHNGLDSALQTWKIDENGNETDSKEMSCQAVVTIPRQYSFGILIRPARWLDVSGEYSSIAWEKGTIEYYYDAGTVLPYPQLDDWPSDQKKISNLRFGMEASLPFYSWLLHLRGGWSSDHQLYADITDQAVRIKGYAAGIGCEFSKYLFMEVAYQRQVADWPEEGFFTDSPNVPTHFGSNVFFLALTYRFGHIFKE